MLELNSYDTLHFILAFDLNFPQKIVEEQERYPSGVCQECAARVHGALRQKGSTAGILTSFRQSIDSIMLKFIVYKST